jgi:hypothetical protein
MDHAGNIGSWGELYLMLGGSSAALIGLLFVAATLHIREIVGNPMFKIRVQNSTLILLGTLIQAAVILTPQPLRFVGAELLVLNLWGLWFPLSLTYVAMKKKPAGRGGYSVYRGVSFIAGYIFGIAGSVALIMDAGWGLYLVTVCYVSSLISTVWNAWAMMIGIGQGEHKKAH